MAVLSFFNKMLLEYSMNLQFLPMKMRFLAGTAVSETFEISHVFYQSLFACQYVLLGKFACFYRIAGNNGGQYFTMFFVGTLHLAGVIEEASTKEVQLIDIGLVGLSSMAIVT